MGDLGFREFASDRMLSVVFILNIHFYIFDNFMSYIFFIFISKLSRDHRSGFVTEQERSMTKPKLETFCLTILGAKPIGNKPVWFPYLPFIMKLFNSTRFKWRNKKGQNRYHTVVPILFQYLFCVLQVLVREYFTNVIHSFSISDVWCLLVL